MTFYCAETEYSPTSAFILYQLYFTSDAGLIDCVGLGKEDKIVVITMRIQRIGKKFGCANWLHVAYQI